MRDGFAHRGDIRLHYLDSGPSSFEGVPLVIVPGALGRAENWTDTVQALRPRRVLALTPRGVGGSDAPLDGYSPADQAADLQAVLDHANLGRLALFAFSMSVPPAIAVTPDNLNRIRALILGDYPARFPRIPGEWVERVVMDFGSEMPAYVPQAIQAESVEHPLWDELPHITCPTLILRGSEPGSLLREEDAERYASRLPDARMVTLQGAGHELWRPDFQHFIATLQSFLAEVDRGL
ncbi:MAG: alpha/beta hydrolase [Chloroflexi bacterium]|nr:alpha/beta hydrolase [Chloroflexota bacterium]